MYRCVMTAIALLIVYAVSDAMLSGERNPTARVLLMVVGTSALSLAIAVWSRHIVSTYVQICAIPILVAVCFFELRQQDPIDQMLHVEEFWRIVKDRVRAGQPVTIQYSPSNFARQPNGGIT